MENISTPSRTNFVFFGRDSSATSAAKRVSALLRGGVESYGGERCCTVSQPEQRDFDNPAQVAAVFRFASLQQHAPFVSSSRHSAAAAHRHVATSREMHRILSSSINASPAHQHEHQHSTTTSTSTGSNPSPMRGISVGKTTIHSSSNSSRAAWCNASLAAARRWLLSLSQGALLVSIAAILVPPANCAASVDGNILPVFVRASSGGEGSVGEERCSGCRRLSGAANAAAAAAVCGSSEEDACPDIRR